MITDAVDIKMTIHLKTDEMNKVLEKYIQLTNTDSRLNRKICTKLLNKQNQQEKSPHK